MKGRTTEETPTSVSGMYPLLHPAQDEIPSTTLNVHVSPGTSVCAGDEIS